MNIRIITNIKGIDKIYKKELNIDALLYPTNINIVSRIILIYFKSFKYDYILLNGFSFDVLLLMFLKLIVPFNPCKLILVDVLFSEPTNYKNKIKNYIKIILLKKIHLFLLYYKNTEGVQKYFHINSDKFRYVPFKINRIDLVLNTEIKDEGYIFCGGKTRRDFDTLMKATKGLPFPVKIVTMKNSVIMEHGSFINDDDLPPNIEVVYLDGSAEPFIKYLAASRLSVLPIKPDISGVGIGVYIMSMALKKCVIISSGPGAEDVLDEDTAIIVPPSDPDALRSAIIRAFTDDEYRKKYEVNGYEYAINLKGEERLFESIMEIVCDDYIKIRNENKGKG